MGKLLAFLSAAAGFGIAYGAIGFLTWLFAEWVREYRYIFEETG